jgi:hypothetical protein
MRDTAPPRAPQPPAGPTPWARAALLEATGRSPDEGARWGYGQFGRSH